MAGTMFLFASSVASLVAERRLGLVSTSMVVDVNDAVGSFCSWSLVLVRRRFV